MDKCGVSRVSSELKKAILSKAEEEARSIISSAEEEARRVIEEARKLKQQEIIREKERIIKEINADYEAKIAESRLKARMIIAEAKSNILKMLEDSIRIYLNNLTTYQREKSLANLMEEAVKALIEDLGGASEIVVYVSSRDVELAGIVASNLSKKLGVHIDIREAGISGGLIASTLDGNLIIDNSYEARLRKALTSSLSDIKKEVFD